MSYAEDRHAWFEGQGLWSHVPAADWQDWIWQLKNRLTTVEQLERYMTLTPEEKAGCLHANQKLALAITPYFFNLIDRDDPDCPIRRQVIPRGDEMVVSAEEMDDSLGEDAHSPVPGLVQDAEQRHRHVAFVVTRRQPHVELREAGAERVGRRVDPPGREIETDRLGHAAIESLL